MSAALSCSSKGGDGKTTESSEVAGAGSGLDDAQYDASGAKVVTSAEEVWGQADMVLKVKEPVPSEIPFFRQGLLLFTYPLSAWGFFYDARFFGEVGTGLVWKSKNRERKWASQPFYLLRFFSNFLYFRETEE